MVEKHVLAHSAYGLDEQNSCVCQSRPCLLFVCCIWPMRGDYLIWVEDWQGQNWWSSRDVWSPSGVQRFSRFQFYSLSNRSIKLVTLLKRISLTFWVEANESLNFLVLICLMNKWNVSNVFITCENEYWFYFKKLLLFKIGKFSYVTHSAR